MRLRFTKMHGAGNDFVMLDGVSQKVAVNASMVRRIADRHFGIGCDQVLIVEPPRTPEADFRYRIFNQDGTEVENCGNGARCFAVFVRQRGLTQKNRITVETAAGDLVLLVNSDNTVTVNMGAPVFQFEQIPFIPQDKNTTPKYTHTLSLGDTTILITPVSMGNPHAIHFVDTLEHFPVSTMGPLIEKHSAFPKKVNAGFLEILSRTEGKLRVFERGVGETLACGTGACAAAVAGIVNKVFDSEVTLKLPGGVLQIAWAGQDQPVMMTGPAEIVYQGQIKL